MNNQYLLLLSMVICCHCQSYITQPTLTSVLPVNSTALTVNWQFADVSIDQSDLIRIYIVFNEYYYGYNQTYASTNYTFTSTNKTITTLTVNFELVNAYYYVCFYSNSTITGVSIFLPFTQCILTRTCLRSNTACPGPTPFLITTTSVSSNSFIVSFLWPIDLPYSPNSYSAQLINNGQIGTVLSSTQNTSYRNQPYQFTGLQSRTTYTVNASFTCIYLNGAVIMNGTILTVTTSAAWRLTYPCEVIFVFLMIVIFEIKFRE